MSLEGTGGNWDVGPEHREIREVPYLESSVSQPQTPDTVAIESMRDYEDAEKVISVEAGQAGALIDLTQEAIDTTKESTGGSGLFSEDERDLMELKAELEVDSSSGYTVEDKATAIEFGHTTLGWGGERVPTIAPAEIQHSREVVLDAVKVPVLNEAEAELLRRTTEDIRKHNLGNLSAEEIQRMIENISVIEARGLPGDEWFQMATNLLRRQEEYDAIQRPFRIEDGVRDIATGEKAPIEIIASLRDKFAVENPNLSLRDRADLVRGFQGNPRAKLEELLLALRDYEPENKSHPVESIADVTDANSANVVGGLGAGEPSPENFPAGGGIDGVLGPEGLLKLEGMPADRFFGLDREVVYNVLRRTAILPDDNPAKIRAMRILDLLEKGKSSYLAENPDSDIVRF